MILATTDTELHALERVLDAAREGTETCKVSKEALRNLLRDHVTLNTEIMRKHGKLPETTK